MQDFYLDIESLLGGAVTEADKKAFVQKHYQDAVNGGGGPWQGILAQAIVEGGWGNSTPGNMMFGVKAGPSWEGKRQLLRTWEATRTNTKPHLQKGESVLYSIAPGGKDNPWPDRWAHRCMMFFRAYNTILESFRDHANLLDQERYKAAKGEANALRWAEKIAAAGYATDPRYANTLKSVIGQVEKIVEELALRPGPASKGKGGGGWAALLTVGFAGGTVYAIHRFSNR